MNIIQLQYKASGDKYGLYNTLSELLKVGAATGKQEENYLMINMGVAIPSLDTPAFVMIYDLFNAAAGKGFTAIQLLRDGSKPTERVNTEQS